MKRMKKYLVGMMATLLVLASLLPVFQVKANGGDFTAELKVGFDNKAEIQRYAPFEVTVENAGSDFSGRLQLIVANKADYNILYETDFSIARNEKKTVTFACKVMDNLGKVNIRIVNKKGKVVWNEIKRYNVDKKASQKIDIGVLSDDFSALGYMDNLKFVDRETFETNLVELDSDTFPEDVNALDMLEIIVISNFSTDILTDEQIEALNLWVNRGGMLIIGTGSNSSKTLSKIKGHLLDVEPESMSRFTTTFGLNYYGDQAYAYTYGNTHNSNGPSPWEDEEFMEFFDEWFFNYREDVNEYFLEDFMANEGLTEDDLNDDGSLPDYYEGDFYNFCVETMYGYQYEPDPDYVQFSYPTATADVLEFSDESDAANLVERVKGDNSVGEDYDLARIYQRADGYIALYGIDFTMNPVPKYEYASEILNVLIRNYVLQRVIEHYEDVANTYSYNYNFGTGKSISYDLKELLNSTSSAPMPPVLFYVVPVIGYLVAILVLYLVNKKKNKTFRLWYWYPVLAIGVAVVIYCVGFSTRIIKPRINTVSFVNLNRYAASEKNYVAVTTPSNKDCTVAFSNEYDLQLLASVNSYTDQSDKINFDAYRVGFRKDIDRTQVTFTGNVALSSDQFLLESIYPSTRTFDAQYVVNAPTGTTLGEQLILKNETSVDLENAVLISYEQKNSSSYHNQVIYRIGDWKAGQTIDMTTGKKEKGYNASIAFTDRDKHMVSGVLLGSLSEGFKRYINKKWTMEYAVDKVRDEFNLAYNGTDTKNAPEYIYIIGFPKSSVCKDIQFDKKYRNERTEVICQKIYLSEMKQVKKQ